MLKKSSLEFLAFLQAAGVIAYCGLVGLVIWQGDSTFGAAPIFWGPPLVLALFSTSALICGLLVFGHAFQLVYVKKEPQNAIKIVAYTALWLMLFVLITFTLLAVLH